MLFDVHAHLDDEAFNEDRDEVIEEIKKSPRFLVEVPLLP